MSDTNYCIANLSDKEKQFLTEAEAHFKTETGKECVLIAWQKA